ncbi:MAG TPA: hypothetical protein VN903_10960 [Polyangia bacterium]|nr:hypothetical protein [Polyangia bacterium]
MTPTIHAFAFAVGLTVGCSSSGKSTNGDGGNLCDSYRRYPCATSQSDLCDINGNPAPALTAAEIEYVASHCTGGD